MSLRANADSSFSSCVPWHTKSRMPIAHFFSASVSLCVCVCMCACDDCVKVLPHCLLPVSFPWASVFSSQLYSASTTCLQPSTEASGPWIRTAVVIVFVCDIVKCVRPQQKRRVLVCVLFVYGIYFLSCVLFFFALRVLIWEQGWSLSLRGGVPSADFVWFEASGSRWSILCRTHHIYVQLIGCVHGRQPQLNSRKSYVNTLVTSFDL